MKIVLKLISSFLTVLLTTQYCHAGVSSLSQALTDYQYAMKVEWDQQDASFRDLQEAKLLESIQAQLRAGASPRELLNESLTLIKDRRLQQDFRDALALHTQGQWSAEEVKQHLAQQIDAMDAQGASWSPVTKVIVGVVIGYAVLKVLILVLMYWDTDPNYGQTDNQPPKV